MRTTASCGHRKPQNTSSTSSLGGRRQRPPPSLVSYHPLILKWVVWSIGSLNKEKP